ncbi:uncharacterized protein EKO05_0009266 [Ascochyta rabiei]|uniref:Uncharacterized protein n=1 Tax=Didymella rabiei TaxID=5454 RepID=A0A163EU57_DIDRA|nr:uncharacterized protein EKO05_0009266 [Ascochyta rabiei]KZM23922.1 hypothetical protein ST47_g4847 [Ascochyta rabiei]UPX18988.1 hypothetical protein EKO05_0009266 [Ascochyta rabiei]
MHILRPFRFSPSPHRIIRTSSRRTFTRGIVYQLPDTTIKAASPSLTLTTMATTDPVLSDSLPTSTTPSEPTLPKLTQHEFRIYNRMAERMDYFHNQFRETWKILYSACETGKRSKGMSIRQFINLGLQFCSHLEGHHGIEERHYFPILAKKQPAFKKELELLTQHKQIHVGLDKLTKYLDECSTGERELRLPELKKILDGFGKVLWQHLDDEVKELGAENMRKYWTKEEMIRMPM